MMRLSGPGFAAAAACWLSLSAHAQTPMVIPETAIPAADTPVIHADRSVTFELKAPQAHAVQLLGGDGLGKTPVTLTKNASGVWSTTIAAPVPGFHYYWFDVDGMDVNDPASQSWFGYYRQVSGIEIPEAGADYYGIKSVPHGEVRERWYFAKTLNQWRRALIYTPPGYDLNTSTRYPVLLLQHGSGEDENGWTRQGKAQFILDNLIASGKARPMLAVMDRGYAARQGVAFPKLGPDTLIHDMNANFAVFEDVVVHDLVPMIDATYRTVADRDHRAIAGLSMGGMQTLFISLRHPELFAWICDLSGPLLPNQDAPGKLTEHPDLQVFDIKTAYHGAFADPAAFNKRVHLLWLGVGTAEPEIFRNSIGAGARALQAAGVRVQFYQSQGTAHEWQTWRRDLHELLPLLFTKQDTVSQ